MTIRPLLWTQHVTLRETPSCLWGRFYKHWTCVAYLCVCVGILLSLSACLGDPSAQQPDPRLKDFHILSSRIIIMDNQAEVDGIVQNAGHDPFPFDVTIDATFYDGAGNVIGNAEGVAEDLYRGTSGPFTLHGQVDSASYSRMSLTLVSLRERRQEKNLPTATQVVP